VITIATPQQMHQLGVKLAGHLVAGDLILVTGPLGAGKTVFAQGVAAGLGISGVTSPTFVIARVHKGNPPFNHVDAYRLLDSKNPNLALAELELDIDNSVTLIEWGGAESAQLSENRLELTIDRTDEVRKVNVKAVGQRWAGFSL